uniref:Sushi domain-containing protein n=1 Tax=Ciona savignyi TaxID=51511 RepID=H2Z8L1_CIOSA
MDPPGPHRSTTLTCQLTGEWAGRLPDCSADDRLVSYVLKLLTAGRSNTTRDVAAKRGNEAHSVPALAEYAGTAKKSATSNAAKLGRYCKAQKICERTNHISDCWNTMKYSDVRPRSRTMRKAMLGLCFFCFKTFCARPTMITLL